MHIWFLCEGMQIVLFNRALNYLFDDMYIYILPVCSTWRAMADMTSCVAGSHPGTRCCKADSSSWRRTRSRTRWIGCRCRCRDSSTWRCCPPNARRRPLWSRCRRTWSALLDRRSGRQALSRTRGIWTRWRRQCRSPGFCCAATRSRTCPYKRMYRASRAPRHSRCDNTCGRICSSTSPTIVTMIMILLWLQNSSLVA